MTGIFGKPAWVLVLLAAAFVVPYTLSNKDLQATVAGVFGRGPAEAAAGASTEETAASLVPGLAPTGLPPSSPLCDLATALRFDVTPQWVAATWPQVTTAAGDASHAALRVPLVSGVMPDDVAGTLTYYMDDRQRVQRITLAGSTSDPRRLVSLITSQYRLAPQRTLDTGLYQSKWNGKVISSLSVRQSPQVRDKSQPSFEVQLDLHRADIAAGTAGAPRRLFGF